MKATTSKQKMGKIFRRDVWPANLTIKSVLVPIDFSKPSRDALRYAAVFAKLFGAKLTLLHVVEPVSLPDVPYPALFLVDDTKMMADGKHRLARFVKAEGVNPGLIAKQLVAYGRSYNEITECAKASKADLIIISTHGYSGFKHLLLGSTTEHVVRHAPCPVLVVRHAKKLRSGQKNEVVRRFRNILVPLDFSECAMSALDYSTTLTQRFNAKLTLLHAVHPTFYFTTADGDAIMYAQLLEEDRREGVRKMNELIKEKRFRGLTVRTLVNTGDPRSEVIKAASLLGAGLIVLSTHGRTGLKHVLLGSVAEYVVRSAACDVLVVR